MDLHGRSILLPGAGSGIGRALALQLADQQPRLTLVGRHRKPLVEVAEAVRARGGQAHVVAADLTAPGAPATVAEQARGSSAGSTF